MLRRMRLKARAFSKAFVLPVFSVFVIILEIRIQS